MGDAYGPRCHPFGAQPLRVFGQAGIDYRGAPVTDPCAEALLKVVNAVRDYLPPDGISLHDCMMRVIEATDNPTINPVIRELEKPHVPEN